MNQKRSHEELPSKHDDPLIVILHKTIRVAAKVLAVLMVMVIIWGIGDVIYMLHQRLMTPPKFLLSISDIFATYGAFLSVLIAISRKVIIFNYKAPMYILSTGAVVLALGITYWLLLKVEK